VYPDIVENPKPPTPPVGPVENAAGIGLRLDLTA